MLCWFDERLLAGSGGGETMSSGAVQEGVLRLITATQRVSLQI